MKILSLLLLVGCSSTKYWTEERIQLYTKGFFHGCAYVEGKKDMNLSGLAECADKEKQLAEYYRRVKDIE
jgi:hypothetical protein